LPSLNLKKKIVYIITIILETNRTFDDKNPLSLVPQVLDVLKIFGEFAVAGDDGTFNDVGEFVLLEGFRGVRL
jgi:hypothetical protein